MMVLLLSVISKLIIPLWFFCYVLSDICRWAGWKCHVLVREKQFKEMHWFSQKNSSGKDLDLGRREREEEKRKSPLFKMKSLKALLLVSELSENPLLSLRSCCKMEVLPAGSFSPFHRLRMSGLIWKRNPGLPILRYTLSLAFSSALFRLISINSQEAIPYINRQLGLGIYFAGDFIIAS